MLAARRRVYAVLANFLAVGLGAEAQNQMRCHAVGGAGSDMLPPSRSATGEGSAGCDVVVFGSVVGISTFSFIRFGGSRKGSCNSVTAFCRLRGTPWGSVTLCGFSGGPIGFGIPIPMRLNLGVTSVVV